MTHPTNPPCRAFALAAALAFALLAANRGAAQPAPGAAAAPPSPFVNDGQARTLSTWAAKGLTRNPVAIAFDWQGNLYVAESDRAGNAVTDTRNIGHLNAVEDDLKFRSIDDRRAQIRRWVAAGAFAKDFFTKTEDRVRLVRDTDGDGSADWSGVFAGGFNDELDGIGAGVLWVDNTVYFACIPHLWALKPGADPYVAATREPLSTGYGVRWCFYGHDLHGLTLGPDGRIYFSLGDRGYNITTKEGNHLFGPDRGGVFRCWPDGSGLELFYDGLRNPQELAFNEYGDLFTGDNNCDSGDRARVVHVVEGGDSGWRQDVQSLPSRGPWNREFMWRTLKDDAGPKRPAWSLPPLIYMGAGPSGMALYPGTGESDRYNGCLFMVDFYGSGSTVHAFRPVSRGASFSIEDHIEYYKGPTITDIAWGYDGRLYMSDWGGGWDPNPNGNVIAVKNESVHSNPADAEAIRGVRALFREGFAGRAIESLVALLAHRDQRVRLAAQYELARRGAAAIRPLSAIAHDRERPQLQRLHAVWALGQIDRSQRDSAWDAPSLLEDSDAEIRAQAAKTLGDLRNDTARSAAPQLIAMLRDASLRARSQAALALGKLGHAPAIEPLLALLSETGDSDLALRHAASYALSLIGEPDTLIRLVAGRDAPARLGVVLALRRLGDGRVSDFLGDSDPGVAVEAARAVYDLRVVTGMPKLAGLLAPSLSADRAIEPLVRRAIEANIFLGSDECVTRLMAFAARADIAPEWRMLALERIEAWDQPLKREGVWGNWADYPARSGAARDSAVRSGIAAVKSGAGEHEKLRVKADVLEAKFALALTPDQIVSHLGDAARHPEYRRVLLDRLARADPGRTVAACTAVLASGATGPLRWRAEELYAAADPPRAVEHLTRSVLDGALADRQHAIGLLGSLRTPESLAAFDELVRQVRTGLIGGPIALDLHDAAMKLPGDSAARQAVAALSSSENRPSGYATPLLVAGGDANRGRELFLHHQAAECLRCHTVGGQGGTAGPELSTIGASLSREKLVEAIVEPTRTIARGYGSVSAMPPMVPLLSPREIRDVVAYLATLRGQPSGNGASAVHGRPADEHARADATGGMSPSVPVAVLCWVGVPLVLWRGWRAVTKM